MQLMTKFDLLADASASVYSHFQLADYLTAALSDDSDMDLHKQASEDFAEFMLESLDLHVSDVKEDGTVVVEIKPKNREQMEEFIVSFSEQFEVAEELDSF